MNDVPTIRPEVVAAKIAALRNFEYPEILDQVTKEPRLIELLWFIQWHSFQPGGLKKFTQDFVERFSERVGTASMVRFGEPKTKAGKYDAAQCLAVWREFPYLVQSSFWSTDRYTDEFYPGDIEGKLPAEREARDNLFKRNYPHFKAICLEHAIAGLPGYFASLCNHVSRGFEENPSATDIEERFAGLKGATWYFQNVIPSLLELMESQAREWSSKLAKTEVTLKVFDALNYAWEEKALVHIEGDSRFGKTESVRAWANMHPGRLRLVATPCTNSDSDLYKEVAIALGMEVNLSRTKLKDRVEYVLQNGGLGIVFDEAAFLVPQRYSADTPPMRLNWIRTQIVDKGLPLVLCATPQTYSHAMAKFVKRTGHNIQQWLGRNMLNIVLPGKLEKDDLLAVAKIHFPELEDDGLILIAGTAMLSESYLKAVEAIAKRSRYIAKRDGHSQVTLADLDLAISEVLPVSAAPAQPLQRPGKRIATPLNKPSKSEMIRRELRPLVNSEARQETISSPDRNRLIESAEAVIPA